MIDKLLEFALSLIKDILPFSIVSQWSEGIFLRLGKFHRIVKPGFRLKIPFVDEFHEAVVITRTVNVPTQSLTTKDKRQIVTKAVVKYHIIDVKAFILEIYDAKDAILDTAQAIIKEQISERNWEECTDKEMDKRIASKLRTEVKKWGIEIEKVTLTDIGLISSIRLFNDKGEEKND